MADTPIVEGPLTGVRVVDLTQFVSGPHCTLWLASLGAEVIKVESPTRPDPFRLSQLKKGEKPTLNNSAVFVGTNLMKRSCVLDTRTEAGLELCRQLVEQSDVVVSNFRPGVLEGMGLGYEDLSERNNDLIYAALSGFGSDSDYAPFLAFGPSIHAFSGLATSTGYPGGGAEQIFGTYSDILAGQAMTLAIVSALYGRNEGAGGCFIDLSMIEATIATAPETVLRAGADEPFRAIGNQEEGFAPHGCYPCAGEGDSWIAIATFDDDEWQSVARSLEFPDDVVATYADAAYRWEHREELDAVISRVTATRGASELSDQLQSVGVAAEPVRTAADVFEDKHLLTSGFFGEVTHNELSMAVLPKLPWSIEVDGVTSRPIGPAPDMGEHTDRILRDVLGMTDDGIELARSGGAFG